MFVKILKDQIKKAPFLVKIGHALRSRRQQIINNLQKPVIKKFHQIYYKSKVWQNTSWLNYPVFKYPTDLLIYQEIIFETKPDIIIETGTLKGGSALFLASVLDLVNNGRVITIDIRHPQNMPQHQRITYLLGSSTSEEIVAKVESMVTAGKKIMVILDSDHTKEHVINELRIYSRFVNKGGYIIVEDTDVEFYSLPSEARVGALKAVRAFLKENKDFMVDKSREKFYLTCSPEGYLQRIK